MKHGFWKRITSTVLALTLVCGLISAATVTSHADYEDGMECWFCGHYHWDEYCCGMCGACSADCTGTECCLLTHCNECGACDRDLEGCSECRMCEDCYTSNGWHCLDCNECHYISEDELCGICWRCSDCMGGLCDSCGFCEECSESENMHCTECGNCYASYEECALGYDHCEECCVLCEQCEECLYEDGIDLCDDCGFCVYCCMENAAALGCDCGEYCVDGSDWYDHICPDCGSAFCAIEMCENCELCLDCCEGNSECSDTPPLCAEDGDYDAHFCEDCGDCFHNSDVCAGCESEGLLLCESCCAIRLEAEGCDCDDRCISDHDIEDHIASEHSNASGTHTATPKTSWEFSDTHHWRACRFCDEASHISNKAEHVYDKYGYCTVCGFDSQAVILILKQPRSIVAKVSDTQICGEDDPYHPNNNIRTFSVAAKGTTSLKYQWYVSFNGGNWIEVKDDKGYYEGAKTNTLSLSVPSDGCAYQPAYKCVITDENGNSVTTNVAYLKVVHLYREYSTHKGELIGLINQPDNRNNIGIYASKGHFVSCVGEECEEYKIEPHSFSKQTRIVKDSKTGARWVERTCTDCGFKSYMEDHIHYFYDPETYECEVDTSYKNANQHRLKCLWPGCNKTTLEAHDYMGWQNHGTPYSTTDKVGIAYQECQICGYSTTKSLQTLDAAQDKMVDAKWTQSTDLVYVENGYSSCDIISVGTKIVIGFAPSEYSKAELLKMKYPTTTRWKVNYYCDRGSSGSTVNLDVTQYFTFQKIGNELKWSVTIPAFAGRTGGGILTFTPVVEECKHNGGTRIKNASQPICTQDGYTGDTVCADCDGVLFYGEVIESAGKHEGNLTLIPGTAKAGTCEQRGYEGSYRCDHCNKTVRGKSTARVHNAKTIVKNAVAVTCTEFGYSGDIYCECGVLLQEGEILAPRHTDLRLLNADKASCVKKGYTGDWMCYACNQIVKYGYNVARSDHAWSTWGKTNDVYHRHTCVVAGCGAEEKEKHTDADRNLICDGCGYSWMPDGLKISYIIFNIDVPSIGAKPDYTAFNGPAFASEGNVTPSRNGVRWFDVTDDTFLVSGTVGNEFKEGHVYRLTVDFRTKGDYEFVSEDVLVATINGKDATVEYVTYNQFAGISYTFEALKHVHNMQRVNKVSATCTTPGKQTYYHCESCNKDYADAAGKTQITDLATWGIVPALGHVESDVKSNSTHHFKVCTRCYEEIAGTRAEHSGGMPTCMKKAKCEICNASYGNLGEHNLATEVWGFIDAKGHAHMCLTEDCYYHSEVIPHRAEKPASEDEDEVCADCGYIITLSKNHQHKALDGYQTDETSHWQICGCMEIMNKEDHTDGDGDGKCDVCGSTMPDKNADGNADGTANGNTDGTGDDAEEEGSSAILWIVLGAVLVLAGGGAAAYFLLMKKKKATMETAEESAQESSLE
ncbi:MAG: hypothetical protein J6M34_04000 [Clostridia bacterium]|nr:hypothetical protein [Clostridia bacterium]